MLCKMEKVDESEVFRKLTMAKEFALMMMRGRRRIFGFRCSKRCFFEECKKSVSQDLDADEEGYGQEV
jgi:hypothetical protein